MTPRGAAPLPRLALLALVLGGALGEEEPAPGQAVFLTEPRQEMVNEGGALRLPCFLEAMADFVLVWKFAARGGQSDTVLSVDQRVIEKVDQGRVVVERATRGNWLVVSPALAADSGTYTCMVSALDPKAVQHRVVVRSRPVVAVDRERVVVVEGEEATLLCSVVGGHPLPELSWVREGAVAGRGRQLVLGGVARAQAGRYYCRGDNGFSSEGALAGLTLVVEHAPEVGEEVVVSVVAGEEVELVCGARGEPRPEVRWSREGEEVEGTGDRLTVKLPEVKQVEELTEGLQAALAAAQPSPVLPVLQIVANCVAFARGLVSSSGTSSRSCRLVVTPSLQEETPGPASARPASLGLLVLSARRVAAHLLRARAQLGEARDRLAALPSLPLTELTAVAQVNPADKLPASSVRKMAHAAAAAAITGKEAEVSLCTASVEGLVFLVWRHLEHFLLYSSAAAAAGPGTPFQAAYNRLTAAPSEVGQVGFAKAGFSPADLERLKTDAAATLTDAFFERLLEAAGPEGGLLQAAVRRTRRLAALHTQ